MNEIEIFKNTEFGEVRTTVIDGEPWFVLKDICESFGESNYRRVSSRIDDEEKGVSQIDTPGGKQNMIVVNESGMYSALFTMQPEKARDVSDDYIEKRKAQLKRFKHWVTHDVLPALRKTGNYSIGVPKSFAEALRLAADQQEKIEQQQKLIAEQKPKVEFFDTVAESKTAVSMNDAAKSLNFANIGRNKLFDILRTQKILMNDNMPYQKYVDAGYFRVIEQKWTGKDGMPQISYKTLVYQKGIDYIRRMLENKGYSHKYKAYEAQLSPSL